MTLYIPISAKLMDMQLYCIYVRVRVFFKEHIDCSCEILLIWQLISLLFPSNDREEGKLTFGRQNV
jgi:hypothetical protein